MELDDLKQAWQRQTPEDIDVHNNKNIIDMIQNKSYGPLASLKAKYERGFYFTLIAWVFLIYYFVANPEKWNSTIHNSFFWIYLLPVIPFAIVIRIIQIKSYVTINKIQNAKSLQLKSEIEHKINFIEKGYTLQRWYGLALGCIMLAMMEVLMHFYPNEDWGWLKETPVYLRILGYVLYMCIIYFLSQYTYQRKFGKHIDYLKDMLRKME